MDGSDSLSLEMLGGLADIDRAAWDALANPEGVPFDPFLSWDFLQALEETDCASAEQGWQPAHLIARDHKGAPVGAMPLYAKSHSYGEYVFDHGWADAYQRAGGRYYPKLQSAVPFTPAPGRRLLAQEPEVQTALARGAIALAQRLHASSVHITFAPPETADQLRPLAYLGRAGVQYHWFNNGYQNFDEFLAALSSQKRKNLRRERQRAQEGLRIRRLRGDEIKAADRDFFFRCYMNTGSRKWGSPYLNREFFELIGQRMGDACVLFVADHDGRPIASALNLLGSEALYGRYWGRIVDVPFLHFELCYYQAIDLAIELKLARVEAGAQGEHKLARGYKPVTTHSAHWIAHAGLRDAISRFLAAETPAVVDEVEELADHTPFKKG